MASQGDPSKGVSLERTSGRRSFGRQKNHLHATLIFFFFFLIQVGYIPYGEVFGEFNGYATVGEYVDYMDRIAEGNESDNVPLYVFDSGVLESRFVRKKSILFARQRMEIFLGGMGRDFDVSFLDAFNVWKDRDQYHQFILGAPGDRLPEYYVSNSVMSGSGAPFHFHCPAVNVVIYGRKRYRNLFPFRLV